MGLNDRSTRTLVLKTTFKAYGQLGTTKVQESTLGLVVLLEGDWVVMMFLQMRYVFIVFQITVRFNTHQD